jgi:hypothetical protein
MNINKALDKAFEGKPLKEVVNAPVSAIEGISEADAQKLHEAFNVKTIGDLANLKYVKIAQAIAALAEVEE